MLHDTKWKYPWHMEIALLIITSDKSVGLKWFSWKQILLKFIVRHFWNEERKKVEKKERKRTKTNRTESHNFCLWIIIAIKFGLLLCSTVTTMYLYITIPASLYSFYFLENAIQQISGRHKGYKLSYRKIHNSELVC